jgi:threonine/homoserine/homoserine lactone efflux protein
MLNFVIASILIELTPGPNMTWLAVLGSTRGRTTALSAVAGICLGLAIAATIAGLGLTAVLYQVPQLFTILRWAGTLYLFYLAWDAWRDANVSSPDGSQSPYQAFTQGLVSNILNPKAYLFYAAMLPQFMDPIRDTTYQIIQLSAIYVAIATVIHAGIAVLSGGVAGWLQKSPQAVTVRKGLALLIAAAALWFFYSTKVTQ